MIIRISIFIVLSGLSFNAHAACSPAEKFKPEWDDHLKKKITESGLDTIVPSELAGCGSASKVEMWREFFRGLACVESGWDEKNNTPNDANGKPSTGLFQMTHGDTARGKSCFSSQEETKDPLKNIDCAVDKMFELLAGAQSSDMGRFLKARAGRGAGGSFQPTPSAAKTQGSLQDNAKKYWGPFGEKQYPQDRKGGAIVNAMMNKVCRDQEVADNNASKPQDWEQLLKSETGSSQTASRAPSGGGTGTR
jgi:hypothetical protein